MDWKDAALFILVVAVFIAAWYVTRKWWKQEIARQVKAALDKRNEH